MRRWAVLVAAIGWCGGAAAQLTADERQGIDDALYLGNMRVQDLEFERKVFSDPYRVPLVNLGMDKPIEAADAILALHQTARTTPLSSLIGRANDELFGPSAYPAAAPATVADVAGLPEEIGKPVAALVNWILYANEEIRQATAGLTPEERRTLLEGLPVLAVEEPKVAFDFVRSKPATQAELFALLKKVDLRRIGHAASQLSAATERAMIPLRKTKADVAEPTRLKVGGLQVLVAGRGADVHADKDVVLTIDLGGDDSYTGRHGAGIGYASILIDLGGNDRIDVGDLSVGAGVLGIGIARMVGGDDVFRGGSLTFGAGIAGVGVLAKEAGDDAYQSVALSQGFGMFGTGILIDTSGRDRYDLQLMGQGASRTQGFGWLIDRSGSDVYRAGGLALNSPLFKDVYYSFAQGFSSGYREDTGGTSGGVGLLTDLAGDDSYLAETYAQAASYWFALGSLYDGSGNDLYSGYHYCQSSAMHMCASYLFDLAGDDAYIMKFGAAHAIGHDYGVAFLLDRAGNDVYAARDSTPGVGNANGVGIFVDGAGEDRYAGPPGRGNAARGSGSIGVFADLGGPDIYRTGLVDGEGAVASTWGVALDREDPPADRPDTPTTRPKPTPGSLARPSDRDLETIYAKATQWGVGTAQQEVAEYTDKLIMIGMPAFEWMLDKKLKTASRLEQRAFVAVMGAIGEPARLALVGKLLAGDDDTVKVALGIALDGSVKEAGAALPALMKRPGLTRTVARAAGTIGGEEMVAELLPLCAGEDRYLAWVAIVSLSQIGSESGYATAEALLSSNNLLIRKASMALVAKFPLRAMDTARRLAQESDERIARVGVELLGAIGTPDALDEAGARLLDPSPGMRIQALLALAGRCPPQHRQTFLALRSDPIPSVRAVAKSADPGR